jgi:hypothetical protein
MDKCQYKRSQKIQASIKGRLSLLDNKKVVSCSGFIVHGIKHLFELTFENQKLLNYLNKIESGQKTADSMNSHHKEAPKGEQYRKWSSTGTATHGT